MVSNFEEKRFPLFPLQVNLFNWILVAYRGIRNQFQQTLRANQGNYKLVALNLLLELYIPLIKEYGLALRQVTIYLHPFFLFESSCSGLTCVVVLCKKTSHCRKNDFQNYMQQLVKMYHFFHHFRSPEYKRNTLAWLVMFVRRGDDHHFFSFMSQQFITCVEESGEIALSTLAKRVSRVSSKDEMQWLKSEWTISRAVRGVMKEWISDLGHTDQHSRTVLSDTSRGVLCVRQFLQSFIEECRTQPIDTKEEAQEWVGDGFPMDNIWELSATRDSMAEDFDDLSRLLVGCDRSTPTLEEERLAAEAFVAGLDVDVDAEVDALKESGLFLYPDSDFEEEFIGVFSPPPDQVVRQGRRRPNIFPRALADDLQPLPDFVGVVSPVVDPPPNKRIRRRIQGQADSGEEDAEKGTESSEDEEGWDWGNFQQTEELHREDDDADQLPLFGRGRRTIRQRGRNTNTPNIYYAQRKAREPEGGQNKRGRKR